jgi:hypothetical protein
LKHIAIWGTALLLLLPALVRAPMSNDSFWIDWVWADQFNAALRGGVLYPRWLPQSHGGLGSPVFYFYPPLAFYVSGAAGLVGLSTYSSVLAAFGLAFAGSGYAMYQWLTNWAKHPLLGAILYMIAPYHLLDFYERGAQAESLAVVLIPLIALGLRDKRPFLLAISYAGLILTHLPLALLASLLLIFPYVLYLRLSVLWAGAVVLTGVGLASAYLVPALALAPYRDAGMLWADPAFQPENWGVWSWASLGPAPGARIMILCIVLSMIPPIALISRQRPLALYSVACCALAVGLIPGFWQLPLLTQVQFPFRILPLAEFAIITGIARLEWSRPIWAVVAIPALSLSTITLVTEPKKGQLTIAQLAAVHPDVPENLPPGSRPYSWPSQWALDLAKMHPGSRFYFPSLDCREKPDPTTKLVFRCTGRITLTAAEKAGLILSLLASFLMIAAAVQARIANRKPSSQNRNEIGELEVGN